jgi:hypothetical protein
MMSNAIETKITNKLYQLIKSAEIYGLRKIEKGSILKKKEFREIVEKWYARKILWPLIEPDLIFVFEDYLNKRGDRNLIAAVEIKFFKLSKNLDKELRQAYREFGQPLRNLIYGFDSVCLWHVFDENISEGKIKDYTTLIWDTIERLKLPQSYFATTLSSDKIKIFKPWEIVSNDIDYIIRSFKGMLENKQTPFDFKEVKEYRDAIKVALGIP